MRVFVAGATGPIGRHLVPALVAEGRDLVVRRDHRRRGSDNRSDRARRAWSTGS
jgi:nucleoside-diphosphate-sugar epimerase